MGDAYLLIVLGVIFAVFAVALFSLFPSASRRRKPAKKKAVVEQEQKDWQEAALRLERHAQRLKAELADAQKRQKALDDELTGVRQRQQSAEERLRQQKEWREREDGDHQKKFRQMDKLRADLKDIEERLEAEHRQVLSLQKEKRDLEERLHDLTRADQEKELLLAKAKAQNDAYRSEVMDLRADNARLAKRHEDASWVVKTEYDQVRERLRIVETELERLKRQQP